MLDKFGSKLIINLKAYAYNLSVLRSCTPRGCKLCAVVKSNAYGHGAIPIARRAAQEGADMLAVANVGEGAELRAAGIQTPILVLVQPQARDLDAIIELNLQPMVSERATLERLSVLASRTNREAVVHIKVDTGMGREGFPLDESFPALQLIPHLPNIRLAGVATHLSSADEPARPEVTRTQLARFRGLLSACAVRGVPCKCVHAASSGGVLNEFDAAFDMIRPGIATYGVWPNARPASAPELRPVLRWEAPVVFLKELPAGSPIGYNQRFTTTRSSRMAIIPVGYADGYLRALTNKGEVLLHGIRCPVRGAVSMDQIVVDVTDVPRIAVGDIATLIGADGAETIGADTLAERAGTISYEIFTGLGRRSERIYLE